MPPGSGAGGWRRLARDGNRKRERRAFAQSAFDPDSPAVRLAHALGDGQSEPGSMLDAVLRPPEPIEHAWQVLRSHSRARIGHPEQHVAILRARADADSASGVGKLDRVA